MITLLNELFGESQIVADQRACRPLIAAFEEVMAEFQFSVEVKFAACFARLAATFPIRITEGLHGHAVHQFNGRVFKSVFPKLPGCPALQG
jgi:hypothetical protein